MQLQNSIFEVQVIRYRHRFLTSCTCIRRVFVNNHNHFEQSSVKSRVRVLFKSTLSDRILSIAGTSCTCIRRVFDRGSLVLRQFGSVLIGNPKYKYGDGRGNNGVFLYPVFSCRSRFRGCVYVVFAAATHHWQFRRRYCGSVDAPCVNEI